MLRGEFRRADGLVIPNNVTVAGKQTLLGLALRNAYPDVGYAGMFVGLCQGVYTPGLLVQDLTEPTIATNGYARIALARNSTDWPVTGVVNNRPYMESKDLIWTATGGEFSEAITRLFIAFTLAGVTGDVFALSGALPEELLIDEDTLVGDRTFRYRVYL